LPHPPGTPEPILAKLEAAIAQALANPDIQKRWSTSRLGHPACGTAGFRRVPGQLIASSGAPPVKISGVKLIRLWTKRLTRPWAAS